MRGKSTISKNNGNSAKTSNGAKLGFEQTLWVADKQRRRMEAAAYKHVVLVLIFLKYINDTDGVDDAQVTERLPATVSQPASTLSVQIFLNSEVTS